jgi:hypothetical protein
MHRLIDAWVLSLPEGLKPSLDVAFGLMCHPRARRHDLTIAIIQNAYASRNSYVHHARSWYRRTWWPGGFVSALLRNDGVRGLRYKLYARTPFEIRRRTAAMIGCACWNAPRQNSRAHFGGAPV